MIPSRRSWLHAAPVIPFLIVCAVGFRLSPAQEAAPKTETPRFSRHVQAVFSRLGCNGGTCHGAVKGQNGFKLSLFGADPALDYPQILRQLNRPPLHPHEPTPTLLPLQTT